MKKLNRQYLSGCMLVSLIIVVVIVGLLALSGPIIGNTFSNIVSGLDSDGSPGDIVRVTPSQPLDVTGELPADVPTATSTRPPTATREGEIVLSTVIVTDEFGSETAGLPTKSPTQIQLDDVTDDSNIPLTATALAELMIPSLTSRPVMTMGSGVITTLDPTNTIQFGGGGESTDPTETDNSIGAVQQTATALVRLLTATPTIDPFVPTETEINLPDVGGGGGTDVPFSAQDAPSASEIIGNGSAYVFHDDEMAQDDMMLVELKVFFDEFYITATPESVVTVQRAPELARPDIDPQATMTPRSARFSDSDIDIPEQLIAWLDCEEQFEGCGFGGVLYMRIQSANSWRWTIEPGEDTAGLQNLRMELWTADENGERDQRVWLHDFTVTVAGDGAGDNTTGIIAGLVAVIVALTGAIGFSRWQTYQQTRKNRPTVFISYRRKVSAGFGRTIHDALVNAGADVFIDIDDIHAGSFSDYIKDNIRERDYFMVLLAPGTLDSAWVIQEILYAQEHNRTIIPILLNDFDLYGDEMPDNLKFLQQQNAVTIPVEHFDSAMKRIQTFIGLN